MNPCNIPPSDVKPKRAFPRVWAPFHTLSKYEIFDLGGKTAFTKTSLFTARFRACEGAGGGLKTRWIWPFTKVRTCQLVRNARPGGKSGYLDGVDEALNDANRTVPNPVSSYKSTSYDQPQTGQPHNDNQVHGPTS